MLEQLKYSHAGYGLARTVKSQPPAIQPIPIEALSERSRAYLTVFVVSETLKRVRDAAVAGHSTPDALVTGMKMQAEDTLAVNIQFRKAGLAVNDVKLLIARHQPEALSMWWSDGEPDWENFSL